MTWIKLDDRTPRHPKVAGLSDRAKWAWLSSLCYASEFLTDGVVPVAFLVGVNRRVQDEIIAAGLWRDEDGVIVIHDYLAHQSSKATVKKKKADTAERVAKHREAKRNAVTSSASNAPSNTPVIASDNREQIQRTENREQKKQEQGGAPPALAPQPIIGRFDNVNWAKRHGRHVTGFCDWVCLDEEQVREFAGKIPGEDDALKHAEIKAWALDIRSQWAGRIVGDGSHFEFWRNRWTETHGGSRPAAGTLKAVQTANAIDEAFR